MTTLTDYKKTLAYLAYLGYDGDSKSAIKIVRNSKVDKKKPKMNRTVFMGLVFGATGCGKVRTVPIIFSVQ
jgi:Ras family protein T1